MSSLVDEVGIIRVKGGGPSKSFLEQAKEILAEPWSEVRALPRPLPTARSLESLEMEVSYDEQNWKARLALAERYDEIGKVSEALAQLKSATDIAPTVATIPFSWGLVLLRGGQQLEALDKLRQARDLDQGNWRIRKQILAIEHPEKFYEDDSPDYSWQREEQKREKQQGR